MTNPKKIILVLCFYSFIISSQNEASQWYFGGNAALSFLENPPAILNSNTINSMGAAGSVADKEGNLLFYTNLQQVKNRFHQTMVNGTGLKGSICQIVKAPGSESIFYIFSTMLCDTFHYSIVDVDQNAGQGAVILKNQFIATPMNIGITASKHCNGRDVWIVVHEWNSNVFRSYLLTAAGLQLPPVTSSIGPVFSGPLPSVAVADFDISPTGKKLGLAAPDPLNMAMLCDFNTTTGLITNSISLGTLYYAPANCAFSSDGRRFYVEVPESAARLYQWDVCYPTTTVNIANGIVGEMRLAPNGKIYAMRGYDTTLDVIHDPCEYANLANFTRSDQSLGKGIGYGFLPLYETSLLKYAPVITYTPDYYCMGFQFSTPTLSMTNSGCPSVTGSVSSILWDFGDGTTSTLATVSHTFQTFGKHEVKLIIHGECAADTMRAFVSAGCTDLEAFNYKDLLKIYPNPANQYFFISNPTDKTMSMDLTDINGKVQLEKLLPPGKETSVILPELLSGILIVRIRIDSYQIVTQKLLVLPE